MPTEIIITAVSIVAAALVLAILLSYIKRRIAFRRSINMTFLRVMLPKKESDFDDKKETQHGFKEYIGLMEQLLASLKSLYSGGWKNKLFGQEYLSLEYVAYDHQIYFYLVIPKKARTLVEKQVTGHYPDAVIDDVEEVNVFKGKAYVKTATISLKKAWYMPIRSYQKLESDPINNITNALSKLGPNEASVIQVLLRPSADSWQDKAIKLFKESKKSWTFKTIINPFKWIAGIYAFFTEDIKSKKDEEKDRDEAEENVREKAKKAGYDTVIRVITTGSDELAVDSQMKNIASAFSQFAAPGYNTLSVSSKQNRSVLLRNFIFRYFLSGSFFHKRQILNTEEIASLFHFPHSKYNKTPEIKWQINRILKAPANLPNEGILLGYNEFRGEKTEVRLKGDDRFRHVYTIGQTGSGKTTLLIAMAKQDLINGKGMACIDPHGDFAKFLLPRIPRNRADDLIYFDPADTARPMGINILEANSDDEKQMVAQDALNIMIKLFGNEIFGPRIQDYFRNGVLTLMDFPGGSALTDIVRLFTDENFQQERRRTCKNAIVKAWWDYTYAKMGEREKGEIIPYFAAKFGGFITNTLMRNIIGQTKSSFDVYDVMQQEKILLMNMSKGILGDVNSNLLGLILVSKIQMAAMKRQQIEQKDRKDFFLYIDEFQNYVTESIESILSEARKYRLSLNVAHQYIGQLTKSDALTKSSVNLKDAIFGNAGNIICHKIGPEDAEFMAKQFAPNYSEQDLINLEGFKSVVKISVDNQPTPSFNLTGQFPYNDGMDDKKLAKAYQELSRLKYGRDRDFIEKEIIYRIGAV